MDIQRCIELDIIVEKFSAMEDVTRGACIVVHGVVLCNLEIECYSIHVDLLVDVDVVFSVLWCVKHEHEAIRYSPQDRIYFVISVLCGLHHPSKAASTVRLQILLAASSNSCLRSQMDVLSTAETLWVLSDFSTTIREAIRFGVVNRGFAERVLTEQLWS
jgi:hypothetical protein